MTTCGYVSRLLAATDIWLEFPSPTSEAGLVLAWDALNSGIATGRRPDLSAEECWALMESGLLAVLPDDVHLEAVYQGGLDHIDDTEDRRRERALWDEVAA